MADISSPLVVVCWKWRSRQPYRSEFAARHVNTLRRMVARNYRRPHEFVCVTDDAAGIDPGIRVVPLWDDYAEVVSPVGGHQPSCYRRLRAFSAEAAQIFGPRFVSLDLDCVVTGDLAKPWDRAEEFLMWRPAPHPLTRSKGLKTFYNGSMFMMTAGSRRQVWESFNPSLSPMRAKAAGFFGSDQAWISHCLGPDQAAWTSADGVWSYRNQIQAFNRKDLPADARIVFFHGRVDPWSPEAQALPWVREHYN